MLAPLLLSIGLSLNVPVQATQDSSPNRAWLTGFHRAWGHSQAGEHRQAIEAYTSCLELVPENPTVALHLACSHASAGELDEASAWLRRAQDWGYSDRRVLIGDPDLQPLHARGEQIDPPDSQAAASPRRSVRLGEVGQLDASQLRVLSASATGDEQLLLRLSDQSGLRFDPRAGAPLRVVLPPGEGQPQMWRQTWPEEELIALQPRGELVVWTKPAGEAAEPQSRRLGEIAIGERGGTGLEVLPPLGEGQPRRLLAYLGGGAPHLVPLDGDVSGALVIDPPAGRLRACSASPDGRLLALATEHRLWLYDAFTGEAIGGALDTPHVTGGPAFRPDGKVLAVGCGDGDARAFEGMLFVDVDEWRILSRDSLSGFLILGGRVPVVKWNRDGSLLVATTSSAGTVHAWNGSDLSRAWNFDLGGGNPGAILPHFGETQGIVCISGMIPSHASVLEASSGKLLDGLHSMGGFSLCAAGPVVSLCSNGALVVHDGQSFAELYRWIPSRSGEGLQVLADGTCAGDPELLSAVRWAARGGASGTLLDIAPEVYDPRALRAARP